jgi:hypothetical protein
MRRLTLPALVLSLAGALSSCSEPARDYPDDCRGLAEPDAYACVEQRYWEVFQVEHDRRMDAHAMMGAVLEEHGDDALARPAALREQRANVYFRRGQLAMAIAIEQRPSNAIHFIGSVLPDFQRVEALHPEQFIVVSWRASMEIALAHVQGDDVSAVRYFDEAVAEIEASPLGNVPSISGTAIGLPLSTGVPQRLMAIIDEWECSGADFCARNTEHAPWAMPGMAYHWAEHYARVGNRETAVQWLERSVAAEGYDRWPYRGIVETARGDVDGWIGQFTALGDEGSAFNLMYANSEVGCVFCHAP